MATVAFAVSFAVWSLLAPLAPQLQKQYGIDDFGISLLIAVPVLLGSVARIPMGVLTDRYGGRKVMAALLLFAIIPCLGMMTAASLPAFLVWGLLLGMAGSSFAVGIPYVNRWFPAERQGLVAGIFGMGNIGTAIAARVGPQLAAGGRWQVVFLVFAAALLVTAVAFYFLASDEPRAATPAKTIAERLDVLRREKLSWLFSLFYAVTFGGFVAFSLYLPKLLVDQFHLDKVDAGNRAAGFVVLATLMRPLGGWLSDRIGAPRVLTLVFAGVPLMALVLAPQPGIVILTVAFLLMAALFGLGNGAVFKLVPQYFSKEAGTVTGLVGAAGGLGGFFPPIVMGFFKSTLGTYSPGYVLLAAVAASCLVLTILVLNRPAALARAHRAA
jgi:NNP family nitrate/nitrite transporter-like MFS transporter